MYLRRLCRAANANEAWGASLFVPQQICAGCEPQPRHLPQACERVWHCAKIMFASGLPPFTHLDVHIEALSQQSAPDCVRIMNGLEASGRLSAAEHVSGRFQKAKNAHKRIKRQVHKICWTGHCQVGYQIATPCTRCMLTGSIAPARREDV